jgi:hypothetical protein
MSKNFTLGNILGGTQAQDQLVSYTTGVSIKTAGAKRVELTQAEKKLGWDKALYNAAVTGLGAEHCPYCACLSGLLKAANMPVPSGIVTEACLPSVDRGGKFSLKRGVKDDQDHILLHINRASDAQFAARQARKAERTLRATVQAARDAVALEKLEKGLVDEVRQGRNERRKGGRFTSPHAEWKGGHRRNPHAK